MSARAIEKPLYAAVLVVDASLELSFGEKALWRRIHAIDQEGKGCFASAETLAEDLGTGARNIEKMRSRLHELGLLARMGKGGRAGYSWVAILPAVACPTSKRIDRAKRAELRDALDGWLRIRQETPTDRSVFPPTTPPAESPTNRSALPAAKNPEQSFANPDQLAGVKRGIPNNCSPEVIRHTDISPSGEIPNTLTSAEGRAVKDGRKTASIGELLPAALARIA
jgi:hypothetical protein